MAVQIDGGRVRLRENKKSKKKRRKGQRRKFHTPWREPKVLTIFEIDKTGKMTKKHRQPLIDGTLLGPDHLAELLAYHLHRLGVAQAELVVFASDGARWIWDRLDWIQRRAGIDQSRVVHVLDFCHAAHHISLALKVLALEETPRREIFGRMRKLLKHSRYDQVVEQLEKLACGQPEDSDVWTEIRYLQRHGQEGHLRYATFRRRGIPCGSGAIESTIRRTRASAAPAVMPASMPPTEMALGDAPRTASQWATALDVAWSRDASGRRSAVNFSRSAVIFLLP